VANITRRAALTGLVGGVGGVAGSAPAIADTRIAQPGRDGLLTFQDRQPILDLRTRFPNRIEIAQFEWKQGGERASAFRVLSKDGAEGWTFCSHTKWTPLPQFFSRIVKPALIGNDARDLESIMARFWRRQFEWTGPGLWTAWGHAELAILDMLARIAGVPVAALLGGVQRREIAMYLSSTAREGDPVDELEAVKVRLAETGCTGAKLKVGGRMSFNEDVAPGWTDRMISESRKRLGDRVTLYADANGSYDAPSAIRLARSLQAQGFGMFEEPCPGEDITMTAQVARRVRIPVAGGENLAVMPVWRDAMNGAFDVVQPDPYYTGGMIRCVAIAREAARRGLGFNPHFPRDNAMAAPLVHLSAAAPTLWGLQEYRMRDIPNDIPHTSPYRLENGAMRLPDEPGFGVTIDPAFWVGSNVL
jgi:L-alanine-DL-glutamate epimerase-like enolase superfamily enzyme